MTLMEALLTAYGPKDGNKIRQVFDNACICTFDDLTNLPVLVAGARLCGDDPYTVVTKLRKLEKEDFKEDY